MENSLYDLASQRLDNVKDLGFNYTNQIFKRTLSNQFFTDPKRIFILLKIEEVIYKLIEEVKTIKTYRNFFVNKDYKKIN